MKIKRYRCTKEMTLNCRDYDRRIVGNRYFTIPIGSIWQESSRMISGGKDNIHLDREDTENRWQWCEPLKKELAEHFEEIEPLIIERKGETADKNI